MSTRKFSLNKKIGFLFFFLCIQFYSIHCISQNLINLQGKEEIVLNDYPLIYEFSEEFNFNDLIKIEKTQFKPYKSIDFTPNNYYWAYFTLTNTDSNISDYILEIGGRNSFAIIYFGKNGKFQKKHTGNYEKMSLRDIPDSNEQAVNIHLPYNEVIEVYIKFNTIDFTNPRLSIPKIINPKSFFMDLAREEMIQGVFLGLIWIMFLYNLFIFIYSQDKTYLNYSLFLFCMSLYLFYFNGYTKKYLLPELFWAEDYLWILSTGCASVFYYYFMRNFLNTKELIPKIDTIIQYWIYVRLAILLVCLIIISTSFNPYLNPTTIVMGATESLFGIFIFIRLLMTGNKLARFFVFGGFAFTTLIFIGMFSYSFAPALYIYLYQTGVTIEILAFSLGLGYRIKIINRQKRETQIELLKVQRQMNQELEEKVKERTQMLSESNEELQQTVEELDITNTVLNERNNEIHNQHTKIQSSIQYAKRIQDAMMPKRKKLENVFSDSFVLFKPKDVVSGDFYWISAPEKQTGKVVVAAVDCTGHGVPGAFMSLVGNAHLNQIVNNNHIYEPADILNLLNKGIQKTLKQEENDNRDGMDISICTFDPQHRKLKYAGAINPLVFIQDGNLEVIKGDRIAIGGNVIYNKDSSFNQHEIDVKLPTTFYLFSDGFQDQFGGPKNKKFMFSRLKQQLLELHQFPCEVQQEKLEQTIENWRKPNGRIVSPQIDDILVIGVKI